MPRLNALYLLPLLTLACDDSEEGQDTPVDPDDEQEETGDTEESATFGGALTYVTRLDGAVVCDADIDLYGTPYTGACEGCDFAFRIDASVVRDGGTDACQLDPTRTFVRSGPYDDLAMAHAPSFVAGETTYEDAFMSGFTYGGEGPYWRPLAFEGMPGTQFALQGDAVTWDVGYAVTYEVEEWPFYEYCSAYPAQDADSWYPGDQTWTSSLHCGAELVDTWWFEMEVGETATISVDSRYAQTAFDPWFWVNTEDGCTIAFADDNFPCTHAPQNGGLCPSAVIEAQVSGRYEIVVGSNGGCPDGLLKGGYKITVGTTDGNPEFIQDVHNTHYRQVIEHTREVSIQMQGAVVRE